MTKVKDIYGADRKVPEKKCKLILNADPICRGEVKWCKVTDEGGHCYACMRHIKAYRSVTRLVNAYMRYLKTLNCDEIQELVNGLDTETAE